MLEWLHKHARGAEGCRFTCACSECLVLEVQSLSQAPPRSAKQTASLEGQVCAMCHKEGKQPAEGAFLRPLRINHNLACVHEWCARLSPRVTKQWCTDRRKGSAELEMRTVAACPPATIVVCALRARCVRVECLRPPSNVPPPVCGAAVLPPVGLRALHARTASWFPCGFLLRSIILCRPRSSGAGGSNVRTATRSAPRWAALPTTAPAPSTLDVLWRLAAASRTSAKWVRNGTHAAVRPNDTMTHLPRKLLSAL